MRLIELILYLKQGILLKREYKSNAIYNHADNIIYVKSEGDKIIIICNNEEQMDVVHNRFGKTGNMLIDVELWDDEKDQKYIVTYQVTDDKEPVYN